MNALANPLERKCRIALRALKYIFGVIFGLSIMMVCVIGVCGTLSDINRWIVPIFLMIIVTGLCYLAVRFEEDRASRLIESNEFSSANQERKDWYWWCQHNNLSNLAFRVNDGNNLTRDEFLTILKHLKP